MGFDQRERTIIAQNAGTTAANLIRSLAIESEADLTETFERLRSVVFYGTIGFADDGQGTPAPAEQPVSAAQGSSNSDRVAAAFPGTTDVTGHFTIAGDQHGDLPTWLAKEYKYQSGKGKISADDDVLYDNRNRLPQFGGDGNPKAPWFRTTKGKVGLWPPKAN